MLCNPYLSPEQNAAVECNARLSRECGFSALHATHLFSKATSLLEQSEVRHMNGHRAEGERLLTEAKYLQQVALDEDPLFIFQFNPDKGHLTRLSMGCFRVSRASIRAIQGTITIIDKDFVGSKGRRADLVEETLQKYTNFARECVDRQLIARMLF